VIPLLGHCLAPLLPCSVIALLRHCLASLLPRSVIALLRYCLALPFPCSVIPLLCHPLTPSLPCSVIAPHAVPCVHTPTSPHSVIPAQAGTQAALSATGVELICNMSKLIASLYLMHISKLLDPTLQRGDERESELRARARNPPSLRHRAKAVSPSEGGDPISFTTLNVILGRACPRRLPWVPRPQGSAGRIVVGHVMERVGQFVQT
jgi:hypothetical protein